MKQLRISGEISSISSEEWFYNSFLVKEEPFLDKHFNGYLTNKEEKNKIIQTISSSYDGDSVVSIWQENQFLYKGQALVGGGTFKETWDSFYYPEDQTIPEIKNVSNLGFVSWNYGTLLYSKYNYPSTYNSYKIANVSCQISRWEENSLEIEISYYSSSGRIETETKKINFDPKQGNSVIVVWRTIKDPSTCWVRLDHQYERYSKTWGSYVYRNSPEIGHSRSNSLFDGTDYISTVYSTQSTFQLGTEYETSQGGSTANETTHHKNIYFLANIQPQLYAEKLDFSSIFTTYYYDSKNNTWGGKTVNAPEVNEKRWVSCGVEEYKKLSTLQEGYYNPSRDSEWEIIRNLYSGATEGRSITHHFDESKTVPFANDDNYYSDETPIPLADSEKTVIGTGDIKLLFSWRIPLLNLETNKSFYFSLNYNKYYFPYDSPGWGSQEGIAVDLVGEFSNINFGGVVPYGFFNFGDNHTSEPDVNWTSKSVESHGSLTGGKYYINHKVDFGGDFHDKMYPWSGFNHYLGYPIQSTKYPMGWQATFINQTFIPPDRNYAWPAFVIEQYHD